MEKMKFERAVKAARKAIATLAKGVEATEYGGMDRLRTVAYRKVDLVDRAAVCPEEWTLAADLRFAARLACDAGDMATQARRDIELKRLDQEYRDNKRRTALPY